MRKDSLHMFIIVWRVSANFGRFKAVVGGANVRDAGARLINTMFMKMWKRLLKRCQTLQKSFILSLLCPLSGWLHWRFFNEEYEELHNEELLNEVAFGLSVSTQHLLHNAESVLSLACAPHPLMHLSLLCTPDFCSSQPFMYLNLLCTPVNLQNDSDERLIFWEYF